MKKMLLCLLALLLPLTAMAAESFELTALDNVCLPEGTEAEMYTGPGTEYARSGEGTGTAAGDALIYGKTDNGWLLVSTPERFGYIQLPASMKKTRIRALSLRQTPAWTGGYTSLTDDPLGSRTAIWTLDEGAKVTWLADMEDWALVEVEDGDFTAQGFLPVIRLTRRVKLSFDTWDAVRLGGDIWIDLEEKSVELSIYGWTLEEDAETAEVTGYKIYAVSGSGKKAKMKLLGEMDPEIDGTLYFSGSYAGVKGARAIRAVGLDENGRELKNVWSEVQIP